MGCPAPEEIDAFLAGRASDAIQKRVQEHVDTCSTCRKLLGQLAATQTSALAETVRESGPELERPKNRVGRYVLERQLGAGGMGVVYVARDPDLGRTIAIKVLRQSAYADRLRREAQALARLDHPNVVQVYDVGEHEGGVFVAMALVDGVNLREWLASDHETREILRVLVGAARGIIAAHAAGMIHRDLKPDNIFVARNGNVLVGDFGLATAPVSEVVPTSIAADSLTMTGSVLGTPAYMAPEQAAGEATDRSDQFSFCVTAYEAFYGTRPFLGNTLEDLMDKVESGTIAEPTRKRDVPEHVRAAIRRGLSADPEKRFPNMQALLAAISPRPPRVWPWIAGSAAVIAIGATVFVVTRTDRASECAATAKLLDGVWNPPRDAAVRKQLGEHLIVPAVAAQITKGLTDHATRWTTARHAACMARDDAQLRCLDVDRKSFEQTVDALVHLNEYASAQTLWRRVVSLPSPEACLGAEAAKLASASPELATALEEASQAIDLGKYDVASAAADRAMLLAERLEVPAARVRALALSAHSKCQQGIDAKVALGLGDAAVQRLSEESHALEIDELLGAHAVCAFKAAQYADAANAYRKLLDRMTARYGKDDMLQLVPRATLAMALQQIGKTDDAAREIAEVERVITLTGGDANAKAMIASMSAANAFLAGRARDAIAEQKRACDLWANNPLQLKALEQLAYYQETDGAWHDAAVTYGELLAVDNAHAHALAYRGTTRTNAGELDAARADLEAALAIEHEPEVVGPIKLALGRVLVDRKEWKHAADVLKEAVAMKVTGAFRLGLGEFALAQAQWQLGDRASARETARKAELDVSRGIEEVRALPAAVNQLAWRENQLAVVAKWRDTHR